jgi:hypothetical protein
MVYLQAMFISPFVPTVGSEGKMQFEQLENMQEFSLGRFCDYINYRNKQRINSII